MRIYTGVWLVALAGCLSGGRSPAEPQGMESPAPSTRLAVFVPDLARRPPTLSLDAPPMVAIPRSHPKVGTPMGKGSLSIGTPTTGFVVSSRLLPEEGPNHYVLPEHRRRGTRCATDDLVEALLRAANQVGRTHPGARLAVGNLGREGGGDVPWSVSHNSGRDADLGFFLLDAMGRPYQARTLVPLDPRGQGMEDGQPVRFDAARNWSLVKSLLTDPSIQVQWLFLSNPLKRQVLAHARARKESPALLARAEEAMAQPRRSRPHNDHLHLRISCSADDVLEGCRDTGTQRSWFQDPTPRIEARVRQLQFLARRGTATVRADALTVLGRIGTSEAVATVIQGLQDPEVAVRRAAARGLWEGGIPLGDRELVRHLRTESDDEVVWTLLRALERHLSPWRRSAILPDLLEVDRPLVRDLGLFRLDTSIRSEALEMTSRLPLALVPPSVRKMIEAAGVPEDRWTVIWKAEAEGWPQGEALRSPFIPRDIAQNDDLRPVLLRWARSWRPDVETLGGPVALPWPTQDSAPSDEETSN